MVILLRGGGGGNRTRVRELSTLKTTCLADLLFNPRTPDRQGDSTASPFSLTSDRWATSEASLSK